MANPWNYLNDSIMSNQDYWEEDGFSITGNPGTASSDTIYFGSHLPGGMGDDHITLGGFGGSPTSYGAESNDSLTFKLNIPDLPSAPTNDNGFWKYNEDVILKEIREYLGGTYRSHYASSESKTQTLDLIESVGDAEPFCRSNAIKYLSRFGKKNGKSKQDILKAIHYCILLYHFAGLCNENTEPYETF